MVNLTKLKRVFLFFFIIFFYIYLFYWLILCVCVYFIFLLIAYLLVIYLFSIYFYCFLIFIFCLFIYCLLIAYIFIAYLFYLLIIYIVIYCLFWVILFLCVYVFNKSVIVFYDNRPGCIVHWLFYSIHHYIKSDCCICVTEFCGLSEAARCLLKIWIHGSSSEEEEEGSRVHAPLLEELSWKDDRESPCCCQALRSTLPVKCQSV